MKDAERGCRAHSSEGLNDQKTSAEGPPQRGGYALSVCFSASSGSPFLEVRGNVTLLKRSARVIQA